MTSQLRSASLYLSSSSSIVVNLLSGTTAMIPPSLSIPAILTPVTVSMSVFHPDPF